jgi:hypothetical protein
MSPEFMSKWERLLEGVDKQKIPIEFIKKLILKLERKRQRTINIERLIKDGLDPDQIEDVVSKVLTELDDEVRNIEFILNVQSIAETVQPETDQLLRGL